MARFGVAAVMSGVVFLCVICCAGRVCEPSLRIIKCVLFVKVLKRLPRVSPCLELRSHRGWCPLRSPQSKMGVVMFCNMFSSNVMYSAACLLGGK